MQSSWFPPTTILAGVGIAENEAALVEDWPAGPSGVSGECHYLNLGGGGILTAAPLRWIWLVLAGSLLALAFFVGMPGGDAQSQTPWDLEMALCDLDDNNDEVCRRFDPGDEATIVAEEHTQRNIAVFCLSTTSDCSQGSSSTTWTMTPIDMDQAEFNNLLAISGNGVIQARGGPPSNLDYETYPELKFTVTGTDGSHSDQVTLTLRAIDKDEPPKKPGTPTLVSGSKTQYSLTMTWAAPDNTGPPIHRYDVRYCATGSTCTWTEHTDMVFELDAQGNATGTAYGLATSTEYALQVRGVNDEGEGAGPTA